MDDKLPPIQRGSPIPVVPQERYSAEHVALVTQAVDILRRQNIAVPPDEIPKFHSIITLISMADADPVTAEKLASAAKAYLEKAKR